MFKNVDKTIFGVSAVLFILLFAFIVFFPTTSYNSITAAMNYTFSDLGWIYLVVYAAALITCIALGISKYGKIKLGGPDSKPKYKTMSWIGMLMGAGIGCGLVFYGVNEAVTHFATSPFSDPGTATAAREAMRCTMMHWGILPWGIYTITGLCMGWFMYKRGLPNLISSCFYPMLGDRVSQWPGKLIDAFTCIAVVSGVSMSIGFAGVQFSAGLHGVYGVTDSNIVPLIAIICICALGTFTAVKGVEKGIKIVSDVNMYLIYIMLAFAIIFGSTMFIFKCTIQSASDMFFNVPWQMFYTDAFGQTTERLGWDWVSGWTVFYWAWWGAFAPFTGGFLAKVSEGRTVRQFALACVFVPTIICFLWFNAFGGNAINMTLTGVSDIATRAAADVNMSLFLYLKELPLSTVTIFISMVLIITLIVTSVNSATYCLSDFCLGKNGTHAESPFVLRLFWGVFICLFAVLFFLMDGLDTLKNTAVLFGFPLICFIGVMIVNLWKDVKVVYKEEKAAGILDEKEEPVAEVKGTPAVEAEVAE